MREANCREVVLMPSLVREYERIPSPVGRQKVSSLCRQTELAATLFSNRAAMLYAAGPPMHTDSTIAEAGRGGGGM